MKPRFLPLALATAIVLAPFTPAVATPDSVPAGARAAWPDRITALIGHRQMSVAVGDDGTWLYRHRSTTPRTPASNEKLLLSMAILDDLGPDYRIVTHAQGPTPVDGVVSGDLWIVGGGDPEVGAGRMGVLARKLDAAGVDRISGSVRGSTTVFSRDWWAPGWKPSFPRTEVALPTALAFNYNTANGVHIRDPERRAAAALTKALRARGVRVTGKPGAGKAPKGLGELTTVESPPLSTILRRQNLPSDNFYAETLGKLLGADVLGGAGSIAKGANAIDAFAEAHDAPAVDPFDSSGLSYDDRVTADNLVRLLWYSDTQSWADDLRGALAAGGQGTLASRLSNVEVRAKTGTLTSVSALSGWVRNEASGHWVEFSILSQGMAKTTASHLEDRIVTILANSDL
jgi:D-alanyl-D-alanine carboxypeptidase/D-alanyl-D-alanine-endopeptidase (penicillin-binding protein 4)